MTNLDFFVVSWLKNKKIKTNGTIDFISGQKAFLSKSIYNIVPKIKDLIIFPNFPILILKEFLSFLNLLPFEKSIIKYSFLIFLILLRTTSEKSVSPKNNPIILF